MNITLPKDLERFVEDEVERGLYRNASDMVRASLQRLKEQREMRGWKADSLQELEAELLARNEGIVRGDCLTLEESRRDLERRIKALQCETEMVEMELVAK